MLSLPGASCQLNRLPVTGDNRNRRSVAFTINSEGWYIAAWGVSWPISSVTVTVYATCTAAAPDKRTAPSANASVVWPPIAPSPTHT